MICRFSALPGLFRHGDFRWQAISLYSTALTAPVK
jgi:hypothetical protein